MKMKIIIALLSVSTVLSCKNSKKSVEMDKAEETEIVSSNFDLSAKTKIFLKDYEIESQRIKNNESSTQLSSSFIEKYNLKKIENNYYFQGFATINDTFNNENLEKIGIRVGSIFGKQATLTIPLNKVNNFLLLDSINYFEISTKAKLK